MSKVGEMSKEPRVSIGLPTYNRPELLKLVLESFQKQSFRDFELIISDNGSPDPRVKELSEEIAASDDRFSYIRQPENRGGDANFWFVYHQARAQLFMWAADDDLWPLDFLERGIAALDANPQASAWFCQVVNINLEGDVVRSYPSFRRFQSTAFKFVDLARFLWEPEVMGKANLMYSIFRRETLSDAIDKFRALPTCWGGDMTLIHGYLCRFNLLIDDRVILQKRLATNSIEPVLNPRQHIYPREQRVIYFRNYRRIAAGSGYWLLTMAVLLARTPYDYCYSGRARYDYENWPSKQNAEDWWRRTKDRWWTRNVRRAIRVWARLVAIVGGSRE
jgi:glycosyltransferase involved in cell wall biosynthesis